MGPILGYELPEQNGAGDTSTVAARANVVGNVTWVARKKTKRTCFVYCSFKQHVALLDAAVDHTNYRRVAGRRH